MTLLEIPHKTKGSLDPLKCIKQPISYFAKLLSNKNVHSQKALAMTSFQVSFIHEERGERRVFAHGLQYAASVGGSTTVTGLVAFLVTIPSRPAQCDGPVAWH